MDEEVKRENEEQDSAEDNTQSESIKEEKVQADQQTKQEETKEQFEQLKQELREELRTEILPVEKKTSKVGIIVTLIIAILLSCVSGYVGVRYGLSKSSGTQVVYEGVQSQYANVSAATDVSDIVDNIYSTVVEVYTEAATYSSFYGNYVTQGAGSGVIYSSDGYIITNNHVIEDATTISVTLSNGDSYVAELVGTDSVADIAVLKINATGLTPVIFGDSDSLKVGSGCIAIGNPLGTLGGTVTTGIISALSREITVEDQVMTLLQTDTAISPGNSGGGLFNYAGELIGIVNAKSTSENTEGIGFAIPSNYVKSIVEDLLNYGYVIGRASIGIKCTSIDSVRTAWQYGFNSYGVLVNEVVSDAAKNAGLQEDDLIIEFNGNTISSLSDLKTGLGNCTAGDTVSMVVLRNNTKVTLDITLEQKTTNN